MLVISIVNRSIFLLIQIKDKFIHLWVHGGISRIPAAIIEHSNDNKGIVWPKEVAPFDVILIDLLSSEHEINNFAANYIMI